MPSNIFIIEESHWRVLNRTIHFNKLNESPLPKTGFVDILYVFKEKRMWWLTLNTYCFYHNKAFFCCCNIWHICSFLHR